MRRVTVPKMFDAHVHMRQGAMLRRVAKATADACSRCLVMPNTLPPVDGPDRLSVYASEVRDALGGACEPLFAFRVHEGYTPTSLAVMRVLGCVAGKLYPQGVTTHSQAGVTAEDLHADGGWLDRLLSLMEEQDYVLCVHAEMPGAFCMDREAAFLPLVDRILSKHPSLRIVLEHISTAAACRYVDERAGRVAATVTAHHLVLTLDDVVGDFLRPHAFCKPIAKRPEDRCALQELVAYCPPHVFLGSDSAPHARSVKECDAGCAGLYTAPVVAPLLMHAMSGDADAFASFTSANAEAFYRVQSADAYMVMEHDPWTVLSTDPACFLEGMELPWRIVHGERCC